MAFYELATGLIASSRISCPRIQSQEMGAHERRLCLFGPFPLLNSACPHECRQIVSCPIGPCYKVP